MHLLSYFYFCNPIIQKMGLLTFLYKLYFGLVFYILAIVFFPFFVVAYNTKKPLENGLKLKRLWTKLIQFFVLVPIKIEGKNHFPKEGGFIVVSNHASYLDIILMFAVVPHKFVFMGKSELLNWAFLSYVFGKTDIPVNRTSLSSAKQSMATAAKMLEYNISIIIFPEGTMPPSSPEMDSFKHGAFKLAVEQNVPIVPISFCNNWKLFSDHIEFFRRGRPGVSKVFVHPPLFPKGDSKEDLISLRDEAFKLIDSKIDKA